MGSTIFTAIAKFDAAKVQMCQIIRVVCGCPAVSATHYPAIKTLLALHADRERDYPSFPALTVSPRPTETPAQLWAGTAEEGAHSLVIS